MEAFWLIFCLWLANIITVLTLWGGVAVYEGVMGYLEYKQLQEEKRNGSSNR